LNEIKSLSKDKQVNCCAVKEMLVDMTLVVLFCGCAITAEKIHHPEYFEVPSW